uniref:Uncharacterized protein n=1 Tax=uncultured bacterium pA1 TaxID=1776268 RepID=A0A0U3TV97_9BACT|nr:hypothetical protein [uncultured bacterium pA1]
MLCCPVARIAPAALREPPEVLSKGPPMGEILIRVITAALSLASALPRPPHSHHARSPEVREERIHLVTVVFPAAAPPSRPIALPAGERRTFLVDARTFSAWEEGDALSEGDLRWLRPDGSLGGRRAVVAAKEVRRRCYRMRGKVERVAVPLAECDWFRYAPAEAGYAVETESTGEVERFVAHRKAPCQAREGKPVTRSFVSIRVADAPMSGELRRWSGGAEAAGQLVIETAPSVAEGVGRTWDAVRAAASWPSAGPLSEFVGAVTVTWTETDDAYVSCTGTDGVERRFPNPK